MQRTKSLLILATIISAVFLARPVYANSQPSTAENRLQQIALFKNGLGFFISDVEIPSDTHSFSIIPIGSASHGTFWLAYPPPVKLSSLVARSIDSPKMTEAVTIPELLRANVGRRVRLTYNGKEIDCVIKCFPDDRQRLEPSPYEPGRPASIRIPHMQSRLMLIETDAGQVAINPYSVNRVDFLDGQAQTSFPAKT